MEASLKQFVRQRASFRCEYCLVQENDLAEIVFHIEHIIALKHGGSDESENLALACDRCNFHKGPNLAGIDPESGQLSDCSTLVAILGSIISRETAMKLLERQP